MRHILAVACISLGLGACGDVAAGVRITPPSSTVPVVDPARKDERVVDKTIHDLSTTTTVATPPTLPRTR